MATVSFFDPINTSDHIWPTRFRWLYIFLVTAGSVLLARSFYLQIIRGSSFALQAEGNHIAIEPQLAARGIIYDHYNQPLLENIASTDLLLDPSLITDEGNVATLLELLPSLINISPETIKTSLQRARQRRNITILAKALDHETVIKLSSALPHLPGIRLSSSSVRNYLYPFSTAHVLGYTSPVTEEELNNNSQLTMSETTGKAGIEYQYDHLLRGQNGANFLEVNAAGLPQRQVSTKPARAGADITLTLDLELQRFIFDLLAAVKQAGAVVVMDPNSGAIQALVNYPSFNPNHFSQPANQPEAQSTLLSADQPLFNRAIKGTYPPGSTVKPLLAAAGLEEKIITAHTIILSTGGINIGLWTFPDWKAGGHGSTDVYKALAESVNTFFYLLVGGDDTHTGLGMQKAKRYLTDFSWGAPTGIDLPGESKGLIPSPNWKQQTKNEPWYIGDTYHFGIGQGDLLITPLQLSIATSAIANRGIVFQPYLADNKKTGEKTNQLSNAKSKRLPISQENLQIVRDGMRRAVTDGSAKSLYSLPIEIAGKTGTAQTGTGEETHAWFTSFGPISQPAITVTILLEKGGKGDTDAIPIAKEIWQWWIENKN